MRATLLALMQCQETMSPPQKGTSTAGSAASWPSASASWPSWQLLWQLPHPPLPSAAVKLSLLRPLSCQPSQNPMQRTTRLTTSLEWLLSTKRESYAKDNNLSPALDGCCQPSQNPAKRMTRLTTTLEWLLSIEPESCAKDNKVDHQP